MAILSPSLTIETVNQCKDLRITDDTEFLSPLTKDVFTSRTVTITNTAGVSTVHNFPIGLDVTDILTLSNYQLDADYYITIKVDYVFDNEGTPATKDITINHISTCNALLGRSRLISLTDCDCHETGTISSLAKLDASIENATYAATFGLGEIAQAFLDQNLDLIKSIEDCNCD